MNTEKDVGRGTPVWTLFHLPPTFGSIDDHPSLLLERGAHEPSPTEYLAPFYQDPSQRIAVLDVWFPYTSLAFPVEALLKLAGDYGGREIEWDRWKKHAVFSPLHEPRIVNAWVSGCRLFRLDYTPDVQIEVYDFSTRGRARLGVEQASPDLGTVSYLQSTSVKLCLKWDTPRFREMGGGRESIIFFELHVSAL